MKKMGIVTPFRVPNYGTKLQAYAMQRYFAFAYNGNVEILNYIPSRDKRFMTLVRKIFSIKLNIERLNRFLNEKRIERCAGPTVLKERRDSINAFDKLFVLSKSISSYGDLQKASKDYECLVAGSDQIWLPHNLKDMYYTLEFCEGEKVKKGSYAASLGVETIETRYKNDYIDFLSKLDFVSVRESVGRDVLKKICPDKSISWVCDPTFLLPKDEWVSLEKKPDVIERLNSGFVFCYFLGVDDEPRKRVYDYAKKKGLKIITVANFKGFCEADTTMSDEQMYNLSVNEFLYLINHADLVCTDSMHATIFSIIFQKNFATFERFKKNDGNSRNSRIHSLLSVMGLESRLVKCDCCLPAKSIDYNVVDVRKNEYIAFSKKFIETEVFSCL